MKLFILLFMISFPLFAQFGSTTIKQIDEIKNNNGTDIILNPVDKVKLNYFSGNFALQSTATGELEESAVTNTELDYLSGVTDYVQDQLDLKEDLLPWVSDGDLVYYDTGSATALSIGTNGQVLTVVGGLPAWAPGGNSPIFTSSFLTVNDGGTQANADAGPAGLLVTMTDATNARIIYDSSTDSKFKVGEVGSEHEIITSDHVQAMTDKTIQNSELNNSDVIDPTRLDVKKDTQANLEIYAASATNGQLVFATDTKTAYQVLDNALADLGGGGGEGDGINAFISSDNPNAELGTSNWTTTGAPTFSASTTDPLQKRQSFLFTASATNDAVTSIQISVDKDIFKGRACEASIEYIGGDENLSLIVVDNNATEIASMVLPTHNVSASETLYFTCPSDAAITLDADLALLNLRIKNVGGSTAPIIKFDKAYIGTMRGLLDTFGPDTLTAAIAGGAPVGMNIPNWISSCTGTGPYTCNFKTGLFTVSPKCQVTRLGANTGWNSITSTSSTQVVIQTTNSAGAAQSNSFNLTCEKTGADAKQIVQVFKSIPKVAQNAAGFSFNASAAGTVSNDTLDFINGNASISDTSLFTYTFNTNIFTVAPNCIVGGEQGSTSGVLTKIVSISNTQLVVRTYTAPNTLVAYDHRIFCEKTGVDYKLPIVQPIIAGQVTNSSTETTGKNVRVETCGINSGGTVVTASTLCANWISSITKGAAGIYTVNFVSGIFSVQPECTGSPSNISPSTVDLTVTFNNSSTTSIGIRTLSNAALADLNHTITCTGVR